MYQIFGEACPPLTSIVTSLNASQQPFNLYTVHVGLCPKFFIVCLIFFYCNCNTCPAQQLFVNLYDLYL